MNFDQVTVAQTLRSLWPAIQRHGVKHLWLFGSRARGGAHADSDIDVLVEFVSPPDFDNFMGLKIDLEDHLGTKVDLLSLSACNPRFFHSIQSDLLHVA